jgi:hypothetical protein
MKHYTVSFSVEGYVTTEVNAENEEQAEKLASKAVENTDCGDLENIDWNVCDIEENSESKN